LLNPLLRVDGRAARARSNRRAAPLLGRSPRPARVRRRRPASGLLAGRDSRATGELPRRPGVGAPAGALPPQAEGRRRPDRADGSDAGMASNRPELRMPESRAVRALRPLARAVAVGA